MRKGLYSIIIVVVLSLTSFADDKKNITITELLSEAQSALKAAFEAESDIKAPYEYAKAKAYYEIAKYEISKLNIEAGKVASLKAIEWSLKAISNSYLGKEQ